MKDAIDFGNAVAKKDNGDALVAIKAIVKTGITVLSPEQGNSGGRCCCRFTRKWKPGLART